MKKRGYNQHKQVEKREDTGEREDDQWYTIPKKKKKKKEWNPEQGQELAFKIGEAHLPS